MNKIYTLALLLLSLLTLGGCRDLRMEGEELVAGRKVTVMINIHLAESQMLLRATAPDAPSGETNEEKEVTSLYYILSTPDGTIIGLPVRMDGQSTDLKKVSDTEYQYPIALIAGNSYKIAVIANEELGDFRPTTLDQLKNHLVSSDTALPSTPLRMYGEVSAENVQTYTNIRAELQRSVFAVDIISTARAEDGFELEDEWYLFNGETKGYLQQDDPATVPGYSSVPANSGKLSTRQRIYSYPKRVEHDLTKEAYVIFRGRYHGVSSYYRVALNVKEGIQSLQHGRHYRLNVVKVIGVGYNTLEEAVANTANKIVVFTVADWDMTNSSEVVFFDNYYISADRVLFEYDAIQQQRSTTIETNVPSLVLIPPVDRKNARDPEHPRFEEATWSTMSLSPDGGGTDVIGAGGRRRYRLNVGCFQNNSNAQRDAYAFVRAEGIHTDDLKLRIDVRQRADQIYYSDALNMSVSPTDFFSDSGEAEEFRSHVILPIERQSWSVRDVLFYVPGKGYVSVRDKNADGKQVLDSTLKEEYEFIESVTLPNGKKWDFDEAFASEDEAYLVSTIGAGDVVIKTKKMAKAMPRAAKVVIQTGFYNYFFNTIYVTQDFSFDYKITYPEDYPGDMKRDRYVMETDMQSKEPSVFYVDVTSNCSWSAVVTPAGASSWIKADPISFSYPATEGYGAEKYTNRLKVTIQPNETTPHYDKTMKAFVYPEARAATLSIIYKGNAVDSQGYPILELGGDRIDVYQGGYVEIKDKNGENGKKWLDRNLKTGYLFSEESDSYTNEGYPMLYPYANPIGLPTSVYGAYGKRNHYLAPTPSSRNAGGDYGDDGLFPCGAPQSGYYAGNFNLGNHFLYYYRYGRVQYAEYQLFWFGSYTGNYQNYSFDWNKAKAQYDLPPLRVENTLNPCPPGWGLPTQQDMSNLVATMSDFGGGQYGAPNAFPWDSHSELTYTYGDMGVKNSGWRTWIPDSQHRDDRQATPFFLPAAGARLLAWNSTDLSGAIGYYKQAEKDPLQPGDADNMLQASYTMIVTPSRVQMGIQNAAESASVRCVKLGE